MQIINVNYAVFYKTRRSYTSAENPYSAEIDFRRQMDVCQILMSKIGPTLKEWNVYNGRRYSGRIPTQ